MGKKYTIIAIAIICFAIGLWPVALVLLIIALAIPKGAPTENSGKSLEQRVRDLEEENKKLRQDLDEQKFIQDIIDKTSGK